MGVITNAALNLLLDDLARLHMRTIGTQASGYGVGKPSEAWGALNVVSTLLGPDLISANDLKPIVDIGANVLTLQNQFAPFNVSSQLYGLLLSAIQTHMTSARLSGVSTFNDYLTYYNVGTGGTWQTMAHAAFKDLHDAWSNGSPCIDIWNCFYEVLQGVVDPYFEQTYTNALAKWVVSGAGTGALTPGFTIDVTKYAGGFPQLDVVGPTGTGIVTVTGKAYDPVTKSAAAGKTWTANVTGAGRFALAPGGGSAAPANSLIVECTGIAAAAGITAGTIYVEAARPAGRALLP